MTVEEYHQLPTRQDMELLERLLKSHFGVEIEIKVKLAHPYREIIVQITKALNAQTVAELGTDIGLSCSYFVKALKETGGRLFSVDLHDSPFHGPRIKETVRRHAGDPVTFIDGDAVIVGKTWDKGDIDILYCDDGHTYQQVIDQLEAWSRFNPKITLIHDTLYNGDKILHPYHAAKAFAEKHGKLFVNLNFAEGLGIII